MERGELGSSAPKMLHAKEIMTVGGTSYRSQEKPRPPDIQQWCHELTDGLKRKSSEKSAFVKPKVL